MREKRFDFIEGMRGVAAMMVFITHYRSAFLPAFARVKGSPTHFSWETHLSHSPLFALINGATAVYMFFLMSGFVLAGSFSRSRLGAFRQIVKRLIRLYPPVVASVFCALILLWLIPSAHIEAARETGSVWLSGLSLVNFTARAMLGDALLSSMIGGYGGISRFGHIDLLARLVPLTPVSVAANIPLWSLHAEFWGSVLLVVLSSLYPTSCRAIFWAVFVSLFFIMGTSEYSLFLIGFFAYLRRHSLIVERNWIGAAIGISLASAGVWLSFCPTMEIFTTLLSGARRFTLMNTAAPALLQVEVSALLFMAAVCVTPSIRNLLEKRILMWLGKISFGLYLTHFPVLFTVSSLLFSALAQRMSYGFAVFCTSAAALPVSLAYASVFQRFVDRPSVDASRHLSSLRLHANRGVEDTV